VHPDRLEVSTGSTTENGRRLRWHRACVRGLARLRDRTFRLRELHHELDHDYTNVDRFHGNHVHYTTAGWPD
jgi:hypothetical protein